MRMTDVASIIFLVKTCEINVVFWCSNNKRWLSAQWLVVIVM